MADRFVTTRSGLTFAALLVWLTAAPVSAQPQTSVANPEGTASSWTPGRTAWGDMDLQGTWTNFALGDVGTSLEAPPPPGIRPARMLGGTGSCVPSDAPLPERGRGAGTGPPSGWFETTRDAADTQPGRVALIVEPTDGRLPPLTPWGDQRLDDICTKIFDSYVYLDPWVRCITRGVPASLFPSAYNNAYRIAQIPGYVVIQYEMIHDVRVIPMDGRPPIASDIRLWMGSPRGRWEGNTLVIETTNFTDKSAIRGHAHSDVLNVVERFTRVDADTLEYEVTGNDPMTWTAPWKAAITLARDDDYQMLEYACHEGGSTAIENILGGARFEER